MQLTLTRHENPLLRRTRIEALVQYEGATPSNTDMRKALAEQLKSDEQLLVVRHVYPFYGATSARVLAFAYHDAVAFQDAEVIRKKKKKEEKAAEAKPEAKK